MKWRIKGKKKERKEIRLMRMRNGKRGIKGVRNHQSEGKMVLGERKRH